MDSPRLSISRLDKSFSVPVLKQFNLDVGRGEVHGLVGENGAGKSTVANIVGGLVVRDAGQILLDDEPYEPAGPAEAQTSGVTYASQELSTIETLSVAENLALKGLARRNFLLDQPRLRDKARQLLDLVGLTGVGADCPAQLLSLAEKQLVEIAKALSGEPRLLLLDEPTAALTALQADVIHHVIAELARAGVAIIYISHRLDDVLSNCDRVTVMRDGCVVLCERADDLNAQDLVTSMSGHTTSARPAPVPHQASDACQLRINSITTVGFSQPISLECAPGEIVGLAGLVGAGRSEFLAAVFGLATLRGGDVSIRHNGAWIRIRSPSQAVRLGVGFVGEDRKTMGIFAGQSVLTNVMIPGQHGPGSIIDRERESAIGEALVRNLDIRCAGPGQDIATLSGGNQQKAVLARWLHCDARVLLLDQPTRGVDVTTKKSIYVLLRDLRLAGKTILLSSNETDELLEISDRIAVFSDRKIVATRTQTEWTESDLLTAAFHEHSGDRQAVQPGAAP